MCTWESNGYVTDDVTWPWKVKVMTPIYPVPIISKMAGDNDLVTMDHLQEMATWESNGYVTDNVTWLWKVKVMTRICLVPIISKIAGDSDLVTMKRL